MKTKILAGSGSLILVLALVAAGWWWSRPQTVTLSSGAKLTLVKVTYGKQHRAPGSPSGVRSRGTMFQGTNDFLVAWVRQEHKTGQWPNYQLYAYDRAGTACVGYSGMTYANNRQSGYEMVGIRFDAFPRRDGKIILRLQEWNPQNGQQTIKKAFVISNPAHGPFPAWVPDPLPNTQSDGDLDVTLNKLVFGVNTPWRRSSSAEDDAMNRAVQVAFDVQQGGHPVTNWQPVQIETSDATGNHVNGYVNTSYQENEPMTFYQWGLWPDEPAWKLRVEFSRTSGFSDDELWTVPAIPVESSRMQDFWNNNSRNRNQPGVAETTLNGIHLKIFPAKQFTDQQGGGMGGIEAGFVVETKPAPEGMRMTLVSVTDGQGHAIQPMNWGWGGTEYRFGLRELGDAKKLNLKIALHKSRFVEFLAKPEKAPDSAAAAQ